MLKNQKGGILLTLVILVLLMIVGGGAYYLGIQKTKTDSPVQSSPLPYVSPSAQAPIIKTSNLPDDWAFETSKYCDVKVPLPPKKEPYYIPDDPATPPVAPPAVGIEGGWWQFQERSYLGNNVKFFTGESMSFFGNPEITGHGYLLGFVQIICGPNNKGYTTESFLADYSKQFTDGTFGGLSYRKVRDVDIWGQKVTEAVVEGGMVSEDDMEYFFVTPTTLYQIRKLSGSSNQAIQDTTNKIFENLQFTP